MQNGIKFGGILNAGYDLSYNYADNSQQIANIADYSYRVERSSQATYQTGSQAGDAISSKAQTFTYDANGNMTLVATGKMLNDSTLQATISRQMLWDEENRLLAISDNGYVSNYWYDAAGERTVKESFDSEGVFINGVLSGARTGTGKFTAYVSPYLVVNNGGYYSKHIYMGSQRITSKLGSSEIFHDSVNPIAPANPHNLAMDAKLSTQNAMIKTRFDSLGVVYRGISQGSAGLITSIAGRIALPQLYFYHSDHLGSSSLITDGNGTLVQHLEYLPFGEVFVEENKSTWNTPYKFSAKELDVETGLYYFGARYYDSRLGVWLSVDPLGEKYPNWSSYNYCLNNPVKYTDPTGLEVEADAKSQTNIINTLTEKEAEYVKFDQNGMLDKDRLNESESVSENMTALKTLANEKTIYSFSVVDKFIDGDGKEWIFQSDPSLGTVGLTSVPNGIEAPSPDNKVHILVSNKTSDEKQASTTAHEAYGHAYFYVLSKTNNSINPWHEFDMIMIKTWLAEFNTYEYIATFKEKDTPLKIRIQIVENQAIFNFNNKKK